MSRKADIIATCDICDYAQYRQSELTEDGRRWRGGDEFDWVHVKDRDVCPKCRATVARAFRFGIAEELQWEDDKKASGQHGTRCPVCGHPAEDLIPMSVSDMLSRLIAFVGEHGGDEVEIDATPFCLNCGRPIKAGTPCLYCCLLRAQKEDETDDTET